jgi:hypothetical protein
MKRSHLLAMMGFCLLTIFLVSGLVAVSAAQPQVSARVKPDKPPGKPDKPGDDPGDPGDPGTGDGTVNKIAVVVGISNYKAISDLTYCDEDAQAWTSYLRGKGYSVTTLIDRSASEADVKSALISMVNSADADDQIAFCSSGHGTTDKSQLLCMWDSYAGENGEDGNLFDYELDAIFSGAVATAFIFLDHCNSGGMNEVMHSGIYMTTTCGTRGYGYDVPQYSHGAWTYWYLVEGLEGQGFSTAEECFAWSFSNYPYARGQDAPCEFDQVTGYFTF